MASKDLSTKQTVLHPLLSDSKPRDPLPAKRSKTSVSTIFWPKTLNMLSFTLSRVGLIPSVTGPLSFRPLYFPLIILIFNHQ